MSRLTRIFTAIWVMLIAFPSSADTEIKDSISIEFAEGLLTDPDFGQPIFYSDIVDNFPTLDFPEQFELVGSVDLIYSTRAIFRSELSAAEARKTLVNELNGTMFTIVPGVDDPLGSIGFVFLEKTVLPVGFCHDELGSLSARFRKTDTSSIITIDHNLTSPSNSVVCSDYIEQRLEQTADIEARERTGLRIYQPRMVLPQPLSDSPMSYGQGVSFSSGESYFETTTMLVTECSIEEIYRHFADQISAQGWVLNKENVVGEKTVGEWTNALDATFSLIGTFSVQKMSESEYRLMFRMDRNLYIQSTGPRTPILNPNNGR